MHQATWYKTPNFFNLIIVLFVIFFFMVLRFAVSVFNFVSDPKLRRVARAYTDLVSILIPVRNEGENIISLLESITQQDYANYEVLILDDDSSDDTFALCQAFSLKHPRFRVIKGAPLPPGWQGKNYACHQLAAQAKGDFFIFIDAGENLYDGAINSALNRMHLHRLGLLSLFPNQQMLSVGERAVVPLMHYVLLNLLPLQLVYLVKNPLVAAASGQFMVFEATAYRQHQWHSLVKGYVVEDAAIMRLVKSAGFNGEVMLANHMVESRLYGGYGEAINGFSKNFLAVFNYNTMALIIYIVLIIGGPLLVMATLNTPLIVLMLGLIILTRTMISLAAGQSAALNILMHPVQLCNLAIAAFLAIQKYLTKTVIWKGRRV